MTTPSHAPDKFAPALWIRAKYGSLTAMFSYTEANPSFTIVSRDIIRKANLQHGKAVLSHITPSGDCVEIENDSDLNIAIMLAANEEKLAGAVFLTVIVSEKPTQSHVGEAEKLNPTMKVKNDQDFVGFFRYVLSWAQASTMGKLYLLSLLTGLFVVLDLLSYVPFLPFIAFALTIWLVKKYSRRNNIPIPAEILVRQGLPRFNYACVADDALECIIAAGYTTRERARAALIKANYDVTRALVIIREEDSTT